MATGHRLRQSYQTVLDNLQTGDLVLFSGKGGLSQGIKWVTNSKWSHVGMAVRHEWSQEVVLWESTILRDMDDIVTGQPTNGVQMVFLSERLRRYRGEVSVRHLHVERTPDMLAALSAFQDEVRGRPYERSRMQLLRAAYDGPLGHNAEDLSSLFCSELVAEAYQRMGLLDENVPSNEYTPADFSSERGCRLALSMGRLDREIVIDRGRGADASART